MGVQLQAVLDAGETPGSAHGCSSGDLGVGGGAFVVVASWEWRLRGVDGQRRPLLPSPELRRDGVRFWVSCEAPAGRVGWGLSRLALLEAAETRLSWAHSDRESLQLLLQTLVWSVDC